MVTQRMHKFDALILRELSRALAEVFPEEIVSITQVHVSKDLAHAKAWISSVNDPEGVVKKFQGQAKELRKLLSERVESRRVPSLYFVSDLTEEKAEKIDQLLREIEK